LPVVAKRTCVESNPQAKPSFVDIHFSTDRELEQSKDFTHR